MLAVAILPVSLQISSLTNRMVYRHTGVRGPSNDEGYYTPEILSTYGVLAVLHDMFVRL